MSSTRKAKKRKVSMEPVLQDFTVTSFSDLNPGVAGPSDSSLFEEIRNYDVETSEVTFNKTTDIDLLSGPYPSDSSLDSFIKPKSISKLNSKTQRPFQKLPKNKLVEENLFDSCLKDSFSDNSLEKIHKPFQRKQKSKVKLNMFDSDLEANSSIKDSPFKKPFQRKSKNKKQSNLFDSILKDSQPNSPDQQLPMPFQRKSKKKISSNYFDEVFSNDSSNQSSSAPNFITRRKNRMKKTNYSNLFDEDLGSSQSDTSMPLQPLGFKRKTATNIENNTGMFDDLLDSSVNESQKEESSVLHTSNKNNNDSNEQNAKSFNLEYYEESDDSSKCDEFSRNYKENKSETEVEGTEQLDKSTRENQFATELSYEQNTPCGDESLKLQKNMFEESAARSLNKKHLLDDNTGGQNGKKCEHIPELPNQQDPVQVKSPNSEDGGTRGPDENGRGIESTTELPGEQDISQSNNDVTDKETKQSETPDGETIQSETQDETMQDEETRKDETQDDETMQDEETMQNETQDDESMQDEDTIQNETQDDETMQDEEKIQSEKQNERTRKSEENESLFCGSRAESPYENDLPDDKKAKEIEDENGAVKDDSTKDMTNDSSSQCSSISVAKGLTVVKSVKFRSMSLESRKLSNINDDDRREGTVPTVPSPDFDYSSIKDNGNKMVILSPDASFRDMPSSTPNVKGKRVSFQLKEETCLIKDNNMNNNGTSFRRKSSLRSHRGNNDSSIVNNLTKDNSMYLGKRRVSFKIDDKGCDALKLSNVKINDKVENSNGNQSNNCCSSVSLESLVYEHISEESRTPDSESFYIDIHPSRGKSTSSSNTESFSSYKKKPFVEVSVVAESTSCTTSNSVKDTEICKDDQENGTHLEEGLENNHSSNDCTSKEKTIDNISIEGELAGCEDGRISLSRVVYETSVSKAITVDGLDVEEEEKSEIEEEESEIEVEMEDESEVEEQVEEESEVKEQVEEESDVEEQVEEESEVEEQVEVESEIDVEMEDESEIEEEMKDESEITEQQEEESENMKVQNTLSEEQLISDLESEEDLSEDQETERHCNKSYTNEELATNNYAASFEQDENLNPKTNIDVNFKFPTKVPKQKKKARTTSLFKEKLLDVPSKSQLQDILKNIPVSELKKRTKRKSNDHCISREQMQQYEIEEELMKNNKKKTKETFSASNKLRRPKKWVSPKLYDFLINKLKPQYGIRSRVRAEELVLFLVEHVECIKKKKELLREDVEEMKIELARLGVIETHWDFYKFVNQYLGEYHFKEKMYPSVYGAGPSAFDFGPSNVMEHIL